MKRTLLLLTCVFFLSGTGKATENYIADEILVKFADVNNARIKALNTAFGCKLVCSIPQINVMRIRIPHTATVNDMISAYMARQDVEYAEPNYFVRTLSITPDDPYYGIQWYLPKIKADEAWRDNRGSKKVRIAVVDTGIDLDHPDLDGQIVSGYDFINDDNVPDDDEGHGTLIAGIIAAETNNGEGIAGINWDTELMPVKVLNEEGQGTHDTVALGLVYAAINGARVINLSFGGEQSSRTLEDAIDYAYNQGCILVAGTGNDGGAIMYPARLPHCIAVGATDELDNLCDEQIWGNGLSSNYGSEIDVVAPGNNIISTYPGGIFATASGTSMSTACVSGTAAMILSANLNLSNSGVREIIRESCDNLMDAGWDEYTGYGRINLQEAMKGLQPPFVGLPRLHFFKYWNPRWWYSAPVTEEE